MYQLFRFATIVVPRLPQGLLSGLAFVAGTIAWLVASKQRRKATENVLHAFGSHMQETAAGRKRLRRIVRKMFQYNTLNYLHLFTISHKRVKEKLTSAQVDLTVIDDALKRGKGVLILSAHLGPYDYMVHKLAVEGYNVIIPVENMRDRRLLDLIVTMRKSYGLHILPLEGTAPVRAIYQALRNNAIIILATDRAIHGQSVETSFFGAPAQLPIGPIQLAQRTGAALIIGSGWRTAYNEDFEVNFYPLYQHLSKEQLADTDHVLGMITQAMEKAILTHPEQWVAFSPIWTQQSQEQVQHY